MASRLLFSELEFSVENVLFWASRKAADEPFVYDEDDEPIVNSQHSVLLDVLMSITYHNCLSLDKDELVEDMMRILRDGVKSLESMNEAELAGLIVERLEEYGLATMLEFEAWLVEMS